MLYPPELPFSLSREVEEEINKKGLSFESIDLKEDHGVLNFIVNMPKNASQKNKNDVEHEVEELLKDPNKLQANYENRKTMNNLSPQLLAELLIEKQILSKEEILGFIQNKLK